MLFPVFFICVIGEQHLEDCEWNGVRSGNTVVYFWSFSLFWCEIEEWFFVTLSATVGADTAIFFLTVPSSSFFRIVSPECNHKPSWVGRMHLHVAEGARGCGP